MKQLVLMLPPLFLLLSLDRIAPDSIFPPSRVSVETWDEAAPSMPGVNEGRYGRPGDPLDVVFVGTGASVRGALVNAGWTELPTSFRECLATGIGELWEGKPVLSFPSLSDYRLRGRLQSMNWVMPVDGSRERRYIRLWHTGVTDRRSRGFWWGAAGREQPGPSADAGRERDFVVSTLNGSPRVRALLILPTPRVPTEGVNDRGLPYRGDGRVAVIDLR